MILFNTQNFLPDIRGTQLYVTGLADALARRGHKIAVYCDATTRGAAERVDAGRDYPITRFGGPRPLMRLRKARAVAKRIMLGGVTAMITDTWKSLEHLKPETLAAMRVLCLAHGSEFLTKPHSAKQDRMIACMTKADIMAANSHFTADLLHPFLRGNTKVRVMLPGVDVPAGATQVFAPRKSDGPRLVTIARLEPRKGIDTTLRAIAAVATAHPSIRYDIIGKGEDRARLETLAASLGITSKVHFHGFISEDEKAALLSAADVFLLPNRREPGSVEGFGIVFLEAAAFGLPSIAGTDGGTADAVLNGKTGFVVDAENADGVVNALKRLLGDPALRETMGRAAHSRFWNEFVWDKALGRFEDALLEKISA